MHRSIYGVFVLGLLANAACGGDDPPPKTPETSATASAPPPVDTTPPPPATDTAPVTPPPAKPSLAELEKQAGMTIMDAFNSHDAKKLASVYADNGVFRMAGAPADATGPAQIQAGVQGLFDAFSNFKAATAYVLVKNDVVVTVWQMTGTHSGNFFGVKATEKPVGWTGASVMWFNDDGKVKEDHTYWDVSTVMAQIGAGPKGPARAIPALASAPNVVVATGSDTEQKNLDAVKAWYGAFEQKTADAFLAPLTDSTTWDDLASPKGPMKGTKDAKQYFGDMKKAFPDTKVQVSNAWAFGDFVADENVVTGTNTGPFMGKPATKKALNLHGLDIVQLKDGKVLNGWSFANGGELAMQMGWIKPPTDKKDDAGKAAPAKSGAATPAMTPAKK